ncbi:MAG: hypothetical protein MH204_02915, partial [Fimbriimonadaceae bacterium]|nr:hypothetical protein [Fimbriimonadaceae bacterium]
RIWGELATALAPAASVAVWDMDSEFEVLLKAGSPATVTKLEALQGANLALVGDELLIFRRAELVGPSRWRLSELIRGLKGTSETTGAGVGAPFALASEAARGGYSLVGGIPHLPGANHQVLLEPGGLTAHSTSDGTLRPWPPAHLKAEQVGSDWLVSWVRRARFDGELDSGIEAPLGYDSEGYAVYAGMGSLVPGRRFTFDAPALFSAGVMNYGGDSVPRLQTAPTSPSVVIPGALWPGPGGRVAVCQLGVIGALGYLGFGRVAMLET